MPFWSLPRLCGQGGSPVAFPTGFLKSFIQLFGEVAAWNGDKARWIVGGKDTTLDTHGFAAILLGGHLFHVVPERMLFW